MKKTCSFTAGSSGDTVTIFGARFGYVADLVLVEIGEVSCVTTAVEDNSILCTLGGREGGPAEIKVKKCGATYFRSGIVVVLLYGCYRI